MSQTAKIEEDLPPLVRRAQAGDRDAFDLIVHRFQDRAVGYAYVLLGDFHRAEDAAQDAFLQAFQDLPTLRESLEMHGLMAKKSFGQHFLLDLNITRKIVRLGGPFNDDVVIEVGPGPGGLTRALLETGASNILAIEKDSRFVELLAELKPVYGERIIAIDGDALKVVASGGRWHPFKGTTFRRASERNTC